MPIKRKLSAPSGACDSAGRCELGSEKYENVSTSGSEDVCIEHGGSGESGGAAASAPANGCSCQTGYSVACEGETANALALDLNRTVDKISFCQISSETMYQFARIIFQLACTRGDAVFTTPNVSFVFERLVRVYSVYTNIWLRTNEKWSCLPRLPPWHDCQILRFWSTLDTARFCRLMRETIMPLWPYHARREDSCSILPHRCKSVTSFSPDAFKKNEIRYYHTVALIYILFEHVARAFENPWSPADYANIRALFDELLNKGLFYLAIPLTFVFSVKELAPKIALFRNCVHESNLPQCTTAGIDATIEFLYGVRGCAGCTRVNRTFMLQRATLLHSQYLNKSDPQMQQFMQLLNADTDTYCLPVWPGGSMSDKCRTRHNYVNFVHAARNLYVNFILPQTKPLNEMSESWCSMCE